MWFITIKIIISVTGMGAGIGTFIWGLLNVIWSNQDGWTEDIPHWVKVATTGIIIFIIFSIIGA